MTRTQPMKTRSSVILLLLIGAAFGTLPLPSFSQAPEASTQLDQILDGHAHALGGWENWMSVTNMKVESEVISSQWSGEQRTFRTKAGQFRSETETPSGTSTVVFDGTRAWSVLPGSQAWSALPASIHPQLRRQALLGGTLLNARTNNFAMELKGKDSVRGEQYFVVVVDSGTGQDFEFLVNADSFLVDLVRTEFNGRIATSELENYREVEGLLIPFKTTTGDQTTKVTSVEFNVKLPDDLFELP